MAEITKISSPLIPKENVGNKYKPETDQAFELNDLAKVHKPNQDSKLMDNKADNQALRDSFGRASIAALLKDTNDLMGVIKRLAMLVETGIASADVMNDPEIKQILQSLYVPQGEVLDSILEQDKSAVLFKGEVFEILRDLLDKFNDNPKIKNALVNLLKTFEYNVNSKDSVRTILMNCENILDYMFTRDRQQFAGYLRGLAETLLPEEAAKLAAQQQPAQPEAAASAQATGEIQTNTVRQENGNTGNMPVFYTEDGQPIPNEIVRLYYNADGTSVMQQGETFFSDADGNPINPDAPPVFYDENGNPIPPEKMPLIMKQSAEASGNMQHSGDANIHNSQGEIPNRGNNGESQVNYQRESLPQLSQKEIASILKGNLLPLLGEIVVKYNQNNKIRDHVMVVVHNTVRVDKGTTQALRTAVNKLVQELRQVANLPENFGRNLTASILEQSREAKNGSNEIMEKLSNLVSETLRSEQSSPSVIRQAETLLMSLLQNQSSMMNILHYIVPVQTPTEQMMMEMYVDPDYEDGKEKQDKKHSRKIFLSFDSENHGSFEMSFLQTEAHVDFQMWCPPALVKGLEGMKRFFANTMQTYGYTMNSFAVQEFREPQSVVEVFPNLLNRKVGIDVRI